MSKKSMLCLGCVNHKPSSMVWYPEGSRTPLLRDRHECKINPDKKCDDTYKCDDFKQSYISEDDLKMIIGESMREHFERIWRLLYK